MKYSKILIKALLSTVILHVLVRLVSMEFTLILPALHFSVMDSTYLSTSKTLIKHVK